ncbi:MAG: hypothetical protein LBU31_03405 [Coriobacteriales bacterium]|jgi:gamma-glutamylcysteine synthetase|nr:hypothetical protein [Coriobacteriales bacterium]
MRHEQVRQLLYERFIAPTVPIRERFAGVEVELPLVNLAQKPVDFLVVHGLTDRFQKRFGFTVKSLDSHGNVFALECPLTGDLFTYDCSYNNLEFSFAKARDLHEIQGRLATYYQFVQEVLARDNHTLTGMGINPHRHINQNVPLPTGRYRMLYRHLCSANTVQGQTELYLHPYYDFGMFTSAAQVQFDVSYERLIPTIRAFNLLEPLKAVLFANSPLEHLGITYLCARDMLWENSMQGYNPRNVGTHEPLPRNIDELLDFLLKTSIYCTERDGRYLNFLPLPIDKYLATPTVTGEYFEHGEYHSLTFEPQPSDLAYLRTYKFQDLTYRGTIEFRSVCTQPMRDALAPAAFHFGLMEQPEAVIDLLEHEHTLYGNGLTPGALRKLLVLHAFPSFIDTEKLRRLLLTTLTLAETGLRARGHHEETYLAPLFERAESLENPARRFLAHQESGTPLAEAICDYATL